MATPALVTYEPATIAVHVAEIEAAQEFIRQSKAANTTRAYRSDWRDFTAWCESRGLASLPAAPEAIVLYVSGLAATLKTSTLTRRLSAISQAHSMAGYDSPAASKPVRTVMQGIRRTKGTAATAKTPTLTDDIRTMVSHIP